jgi:uncharacterized protein
MVYLASTETAHETIVRCVLECVEPELILLFGSRAWGTARDDSDYDLMLVVRSDGGLDLRRAVHEALAARRIGADVITISTDEYARQQHDPGRLAYQVAREGQVLYTTGAVSQHIPRSARVGEEPPREGLALWIRRAESDIRTAEHEIVSPEPVWDAICFHSHACIEKLLKALIIRTGTFPPRTHVLADLLDVLPPVIRDAPRIANDCALLTALWPNSRYPDLPEPTPDEAARAIAAARNIRLFLLPFLSDNRHRAAGVPR